MANYAPVTLHSGVAYTAGMTPRAGDDMVYIGRVGEEVSVEDAYSAAGLAAERALAAIEQRFPNARLDPLQMTVYIAAGQGFSQLSSVADGASDAVSARTGSVPARAAIGVLQLPGGAPVEVTLVAAVNE